VVRHGHLVPGRRHGGVFGRGARESAVTGPANHVQSAGNMEGKEVRFGIANSALWAVVTTDTSAAL